MIGANDVFIAARACSLGLTLVTNKYAGVWARTHLTSENWTT
jgi:predicted nucleic acid-binding protein